MAKVLSIEIGPSLTRLCEVDYKEKNPKVYKWATIQTPEGALKDDIVEVNDSLVSAIKGALHEKHMNAKKLVFAMNSTKIASREVVIPFVKENKVGEIVRANASDFFPVDLEQYELGYSIIGAFDNEKGVKQYKVHVLAAPKTIIESYLELAKALGGSVEALDYSGNSIYQMVHSNWAEGVQMVVKVDERASIITIIKNQTIALQRTISYGVDDAIAAIMNSSYQDKITYMQAMKTLQEQNCFADEFDIEDGKILDMDSTDGVAQTLQEEVGASLNYLTTGISRVADYYNSRNTDAVIEKIYVTGLGGDCKGIDKFLSKSLESDVEVLRELQECRLDKYFKDESFGPYLTCIGASIAPLGFTGHEVEKGKKLEVVPQKDSMKAVSVLVCVGGILIAGVLAATSYLNVRNMQKEKRQLEERVEELQPIKEIYKTYLQQQYTHAKLDALYRYTVIPNEELIAFIEEMEEKMPSSLNVQAFVSTIEGVDISLSVEDKKEAAKVIQQFRSFETISAVSVSGINDTGAVMEGEPIEQEGKVIFTISLTYKGTEEREAELLAKQAAEEAVEAEQPTETDEQE